MAWDLFLLIGGLGLLFFGGEGLVRGSVAIAERLNISKLVVGMVIVGFGTSAPELLVSVQAALAGSPDIAIGNIVGSNIANILLIVGVAALIMPIAVSDKSIRRECVVMTAVSIGMLPFLFSGQISRLSGIALLIAMGLYLAITILLEKKRRTSVFVQEATVAEEQINLSGLRSVIEVVLGLIMLVAGARFMVDGATGIARDFGVTEAVIGLTIVAVGTSLPELATALVAAWRQHSDVVLANIVGSNIFNILAILGITAVVAPVSVATRFAVFDGPIMVSVAIVLLALLYLKTIGRLVGIGLLTAYALYIAVQGTAA
jgi:cation:H+ antiporter